jgi:hypothetical protein
MLRFVLMKLLGLRELELLEREMRERERGLRELLEREQKLLGRGLWGMKMREFQKLGSRELRELQRKWEREPRCMERVLRERRREQELLKQELLELVLVTRWVPKWMQLKAPLTFGAKSKGEDWTIALGWFIPRKYRHVIGDILEDCAEMRDLEYTERRIKFHVLYQWIIAVVTLVPMAVKTSITDILKQVISPPK